MMLKKFIQHFSKNKTISFVILLGSVAWSLVMVRSGLRYAVGYGFWGPNGHDGIWHLALAESLSRGSFDNPVFAGEVLKNYHLGFDLLTALLHRLTGIEIATLYFQILPVIFSLLVGWLVYKFVYLWRSSQKEALWSSFFVYFSSGLGFLFTYFKDGVISGESMFWSQQSLSTLVNPPFALSLIFILLGLIILQKYLKNQKPLFFFISVLFFGLLIQIKAYSAILVLAGLFVAGVYSLLLKRSCRVLNVFIGSLLLNFSLFLLFKPGSVGSVFSWQPFWFLETMMAYSDRLGWYKFYSAMTTYKMGELWFKALLAYGAAFAIFLICNMGLRIIGFYFLLKTTIGKVKLNETTVFIFSIILLGVLIPMLFVQQGTPWNTIQFFYYFLFFFSILTGISTSWLLDSAKPVFRNTLLVLIFAFSFFGSWSTLINYLPSQPQAKISDKEYEALSFLSKQPDGVVLIYPFDAVKAKAAESNPPRPLYLYDSTAYVSAYGKKDVFLEDEVNLNIMDYDWKQRRELVESWYKQPDEAKARDFLKENNIMYVYWVRGEQDDMSQRAYVGDQQLGLQEIFKNDLVYIYKVK